MVTLPSGCTASEHKFYSPSSMHDFMHSQMNTGNSLRWSIAKDHSANGKAIDIPGFSLSAVTMAQNI